MEFYDVVESRRSVRRFTDEPVSDEALGRIFEAVRQSPSWANMQCWRFVVLRNPEARSRISELSYVESFFAPKGYKANPAKKGLAEAPVVIVACADPAGSGVHHAQNYYLVDVGIAAQSLMLAVVAEGLGSVYVGVYDEDEIKQMLAIPDEVRVVGLFPVGHPLDTKVPKGRGTSRKELAELVFNGKWGV